MNKQEYDNLIERAQPFIGQEFMVNIASKPTIQNLKPYKFNNIKHTVGFSEEGEEMKFQMPSAILINENGDKKTKPLNNVIEYFEKNQD
jgi:hypothetical protein